MSNIDERIRESLSSEDRAFFAQLDSDGSLYREVTATFQGRMRWLNAIGWAAGLLLFVVALFCGWRFTNQVDLHSMQLWGAATALAVLGLALIKVWFWMELKTNAILREIKRVELQVAGLSAARQAGN